MLFEEKIIKIDYFRLKSSNYRGLYVWLSNFKTMHGVREKECTRGYHGINITCIYLYKVFIISVLIIRT